MRLVFAKAVAALAGGALVGAMTAVVAAQFTAPPAGEYSCLKSRYQFSPVSGPAGPLMLLVYDPSVLGTLRLDGKGTYRTSRSSGRYTYNRKTGAFALVSGGLKGWPVAFEVARGVPRVILAPTKTGRVGRVGQHVCQRRGKERFPDTPRAGSPGGGGTGTGRPGRMNGAFRGTLTFAESWGSNSIADVDLATGRLVARFKGRDPYRSARGETVFTNERGTLVIVGRNGVNVATTPVRERDGRPDMAVLSPDGDKVAYHVSPVYYVSRVIVASRAGQQLAEFEGVTEPDWTPDGRLVVANSLGTEKSEPAILLSDTGLTRLTRIDPGLDDARQPRVSPDGKRVAFVRHGHIWVMGLDGRGLRQITSGGDNEERPTWAPDGRALAAANREYGTVLLVSLSNGQITKLRVARRDGDGRYSDHVQSKGRITWR